MEEEFKEQIFLEEKEYLRKIKEWLDEEILRLKNKLLVLEEQEIELKSAAWEERLDLKDGVNQADNALVQQALRLVHGEKESAKKQIKDYQMLKNRPYFGKINFAYEGEEGEDYYIGLRSLYDAETCESLVLDWRSPLASLYYEAEPGEVYIDGPRGKIKGHLFDKKLLSINKGELLALEEYDDGVSDRFLRELLARPSSGEMRDIVATIQRQQNKIIRIPEHDSLLLLGVAGSGKTSIALHRAAWLLYQQRFAANRILFVGPNHIFGEYVMSVMPALGEETLNFATIMDIEQELLGERSLYLAGFSYDEAGEDRLKLASGELLIQAVDRFVARKKKAAARFETPDIRAYYSEFLVSPELSSSLPALCESALYRRLDRVDLAILARIAQRLRKAKNTKQYYYVLVDEAQDLLPIEHRILKDLYDCPFNLFADTGQAIRFDLPENYIANLSATYGISTDKVFELKTTYRSTFEIMDFAKKIIDDEELIPFARFGERVKIEDVKSPEEHVKRAFEIICGFYERGARRIAILCRQLAEQKAFYYGMGRLFGKLPPAAEAPASKEDRETAGSENRHFGEKKQEVLLEMDHFPWSSPNADHTRQEAWELFVLDVRMAKGLEFDAVLLLNASAKAYCTEREKKLLYVACTRALHELHILYSGEPSPFIPGLNGQA